ncbi:hypothetical protein K491DRAFT_712745 [Lophiostoma macrostomum CBS 122681]|uniref:RWD domain-containing protein n=1 Tax=Lophiostoma macrostomum CBS 122681 TaxID=1314788 RepID=A0A6A6TKQ3_9PLEO|nr:hypothetical protein K491DRAFT_712745 [Lophiostoma macrostomum CBS 122681]
MSGGDDLRLEMELQLLEAMYPDQTQFDARSRDFKFSDGAAVLQLRLPDTYPESDLPSVLSATDLSKNDTRDRVQAEIESLHLAEGEEALDAIIAGFQSIVAATNNTSNSQAVIDTPGGTNQTPMPESGKTVIIWLHHLLALSKRKLALAPSSSVTGVTKPGYPGVMVFSGPTSAVSEHINGLKAENWQAFQVRYEEAVLWDFAHGVGVREVETMGEIAKAIEAGDRGTERKADFLKAVGIK